MNGPTQEHSSKSEEPVLEEEIEGIHIEAGSLSDFALAVKVLSEIPRQVLPPQIREAKGRVMYKLLERMEQML